jgi:hypothetical protein
MSSMWIRRALLLTVITAAVTGCGGIKAGGATLDDAARVFGANADQIDDAARIGDNGVNQIIEQSGRTITADEIRNAAPDSFTQSALSQRVRSATQSLSEDDKAFVVDTVCDAWSFAAAKPAERQKSIADSIANRLAGDALRHHRAKEAAKEVDKAFEEGKSGDAYHAIARYVTCELAGAAVSA